MASGSRGEVSRVFKQFVNVPEATMTVLVRLDDFREVLGVAEIELLPVRNRRLWDWLHD